MVSQKFLFKPPCPLSMANRNSVSLLHPLIAIIYCYIDTIYDVISGLACGLKVKRLQAITTRMFSDSRLLKCGQDRPWEWEKEENRGLT